MGGSLAVLANLKLSLATLAGDVSREEFLLFVACVLLLLV